MKYHPAPNCTIDVQPHRIYIGTDSRMNGMDHYATISTQRELRALIAYLHEFERSWNLESDSGIPAFNVLLPLLDKKG